MQHLDDNALLREYVERGSEDAFAELVARHINKVYSAALRHTGNANEAAEITQAVFVILAQKSRRLGKGVILSGWLYHTARLASLTYIRSEMRRRQREREAYMRSIPEENETEMWPQIAPLLDDAMAGLNETDRYAVVLRFFDGKSLGEVGVALGASEDAAKKRVTRAVEKLRRFFVKRGIVIPASALTVAISVNSAQAAPAVLAKTATAVAVAKGAAASASTLTLIKGALKLMAWTKAKTAVVVAVTAAVLGAGTATVILVEHSGNPAEYIQEGWKLWQQQKWKESAAMFAKATSRAPQSAEAWNGLGWSTLNSGDQPEAEKAFQKVVSLKPAHNTQVYATTMTGLGQIYLSEKRYDEAEALLLQSTGPAAWYSLARVDLLQEKFGEAQKWAQKFVDSGEVDDTATAMLKAAKAKQLPDDLRALIEPR